ncbi:tRNA (N(6)-L-threonylcarbamoyladenosine(37)-C(2))-methylthiotransferase MtaB [Campylobacter volucris]|uniref:tRNA (N(6)-L-threonylcarbamoyladenosine(37)-C(2))-methylthiotransferase MtaB n=1 Tax=Campylobacter volucris TaxID=1031542 RepID=A0AAE5YHY3_9BACT|nr:tRNA (N(6)-L-threonylcarbamoyladenosine(37)-C(2))-methylthiotransferase MtaB [Campylobacter volucris]AJC94003.1 MiaB-like tRNA modifying enzyme [Campylobacter volucris LMG 24379]KAB0580163.1 tRNA (N(6)-L-threonylcarbamoyladenosine(37)-C(2))-methylthiotransferase MtaB [Campylobacter volucris]QBL13622.1 tRNA (N(6)-L-threonylcarbamoyladenosine(37)-C(2))-methylthiotransferase MtaB [Campylobacter volucris]QEL08217.1 putative tRNA (N6-L-threonylcarbamoyladenosine37-C2)-methylthiotransferase MtaB [
MKKKVFFKTFGCRTNIYDTQLLKTYIKEHEIVQDETQADVVVINSCTVTNGADSGLRAYINSVKKNGVKVILTGCGAVSKGKDFFDKKEIFGVLGASNKNKINEFISYDKEFYELGNLNFIDTKIVSDYKNHTKAFVKIQEGCDFACSYCIIPSVRGKSRSVLQDEIVKQIKILAQNGYSEIVLTGTNIGSYGLKEKTTLGRLLQLIGKIDGIKRIRLGSLEPAQIDESFKEILNETWLERHLHIALQHTHEKMLRIMRRRSHTENDLALFNELSQKGFALGTDFIVAHPGESEEIWKSALENFKNFNLTHIHAFIFSPRDGTHSASMSERINGEIAKERLNTLKTIVEKNNFEFRKKQKQKLEILVESKKGEFYEGYDQFFNKIKIQTKQDIAKQWLEIEKYDIKYEYNFVSF